MYLLVLLTWTIRSSHGPEDPSLVDQQVLLSWNTFFSGEPAHASDLSKINPNRFQDLKKMTSLPETSFFLSKIKVVLQRVILYNFINSILEEGCDSSMSTWYSSSPKMIKCMLNFFQVTGGGDPPTSSHILKQLVETLRRGLVCTINFHLLKIYFNFHTRGLIFYE